MDGVKDEKCYDYGGSPIFRGGWGRGGGHKKTIYLGNCLKGGGGIGQFARAWKKIERRVFSEGVLIPWCIVFWYMPELEIGLADVSTLNFLQFNAKKKNESEDILLNCI